jgi:transposase-like protein
VSSKAKRRVFTAKYKAKILREAEACAGKHGAVGALLRREGLYSSHLTSWRKEAEAGLEAKKRGPRAKVDARDRRIAQLERQLRRSTERAERAEALVELQKKVSQLMGIALPEPPDEDS